MQKGFVPILIIIFVLLIGYVAWIGFPEPTHCGVVMSCHGIPQGNTCYGYKSVFAYVDCANTSEIKPSFSPKVEETANWKIYKNNNFKFEVKYPLGWEIKENEVKFLEDQSNQKIPVGSVIFSKNNQTITITGNFQGSWCDGDKCKTEEVTTDSGIKGMKWVNSANVYYNFRIGSNNISISSNLGVNQLSFVEAMVKSITGI